MRDAWIPAGSAQAKFANDNAAGGGGGVTRRTADLFIDPFMAVHQVTSTIPF